MKKRIRERKLIRLPGWDYRCAATYFVTICTSDRQPFFGDIHNGSMCLSKIGTLAQSEWLKTATIRTDMNVRLGAFVILPNHIHGIIAIGHNKFNTVNGVISCRATMHCGPTEPMKTPPSQFGPQSKNLASIIRGYKSAVTKQAHQIDPHFAWQSRYHDHIIRNPDSRHMVEMYIRNNINQWVQDRLYI